MMTGFVRFVELEDKTLYVKVDSKFNVIYFLGKYFLKRFNNQKFSKLWQTFFKSVARESRKNKNLQRQLVPFLFRTYINEFFENIEAKLL